MAWEDWYKKEVVGESQGKWEDWYKSNVEEPNKFENFNKSLGNTLPQQLDRVRVQPPQINIKSPVVNNPSSSPESSGMEEGLLTKGVNVAKNVGKEFLGGTADLTASFQNLMRKAYLYSGMGNENDDTYKALTKDMERVEARSKELRTTDENSSLLERAAKGAVRTIPNVLSTAGLGSALGAGAKALGVAPKIANAARMTPFAGSAFGSGAREAEQQGASEGQQFAKGLASAAIEAGTESIGMPNYMKKLLGNGQAAESGIKEFIKDIGKEAFQEGITEPLYALSDKAILGKDINMQELGMNTLESAVAGGLMGAMFNSADLASGAIQSYKDNNIKSYDDLTKKGFNQVNNTGLWFNEKTGEVFVEKGAYQLAQQETIDNAVMQYGFNPDNDIAEVEGLGYVEVLGDLGDSVAIKTADGQQYPIRKSLFDATARVSKASPNLGLPAPVERIQNTNVLPSSDEVINLPSPEDRKYLMTYGKTKAEYEAAQAEKYKEREEYKKKRDEIKSLFNYANVSKLEPGEKIPHVFSEDAPQDAQIVGHDKEGTLYLTWMNTPRILTPDNKTLRLEQLPQASQEKYNTMLQDFRTPKPQAKTLETTSSGRSIEDEDLNAEASKLIEGLSDEEIIDLINAIESEGFSDDPEYDSYLAGAITRLYVSKNQTHVKGERKYKYTPKEKIKPTPEEALINSVLSNEFDKVDTVKNLNEELKELGKKFLRAKTEESKAKISKQAEEIRNKIEKINKFVPDYRKVLGNKPTKAAEKREYEAKKTELDSKIQDAVKNRSKDFTNNILTTRKMGQNLIDIKPKLRQGSSIWGEAKLEKPLTKKEAELVEMYIDKLLNGEVSVESHALDNTIDYYKEILAQNESLSKGNINTQPTPKLTQKQQEAQINMSERTTSNVGNQKVKAYQYLHPEVKPHIQSEAEILLNELQNSQKSEAKQVKNNNGTITSGFRDERITSQSIATMLDGFTFDTRPGKPGKYEQIEKALQDIIKDNGAENHALAKKIEVIIDDRLSNGYSDFYTGSDIPANEEYKSLKNKIETPKKVNNKKKTPKKEVKLSAEEKAKKAERDAEEAIAAVKETAKGDNLRSEAGKVDYTKGLLGLSFNRQLIKNGYVDLKGQRVTNYKELATIAQVFRDPRFETFRIIYMKGEEIVGHEGITSRIPHSARVSDKDTMSEHYAEIKGVMKKLNADGIYIMHNHPTGDPTPSDADIEATKLHAKAIPGFKGHVIINSNKFATIDNGGNSKTEKLGLDKKAEEELNKSLFEKYNVDNDEDLYKVISEEDAEKHLMFQWQDELLSPEMQHPLLNQRINGASKLAEIAKTQQLNPNTVVVVYADAKLKIRGIQEVEDITFESYEKAKEYLKPRMSEFGASNSFIVSSDNISEDMRNAFTTLVKRAITTDIVFNSGESFRDKGIKPGLLYNETWFEEPYTEVPAERMSVMENKNPLEEADIDPYEDFDNGEDKFEDQIRRREAYVKNLIENNTAVEFKNGDYTMTVSPSTKGQKYQATTFYKGEPLSDKNYDTSEEAAKRIVDDGYKEVGQTVMEKGKDYSVVDKTLVALHNISEDKLLKTIELGGFPVPSIAVTKKDIPFEFGGGITLVGNKDLVNPEVNRDNKVFDTDVYSRRIPTEYAEVNYSAKREILAKFKDSFEEVDENKLSVDNAIDTERPDEAFQTLWNKKGTRLQYFKEKGTKIKIPIKKIGPEILELSIAQKFLKDHPEVLQVERTSFNMTAEQKEKLKAQNMAKREKVRELLQQLELENWTHIANTAFKGDETKKQWFIDEMVNKSLEDGKLTTKRMIELKDDLRKAENPREEVDSSSLRDLLDKKLSTPKAKADYETWLKDTLAPAFGRHYFYDNNKKKSFDLDNVYDYMSGRIKATESNNMNAGSAKAKGARQFKSIDEMHRYEDSITTTENVDAFKEEFNKSSLALLKALDEYHVTPGSWSNDNSLFSALGDYLGGKTPATALSANGYKKVPKELVSQLVEVAKQLKNAPVNYYEAKPQRIVKLNEFVGAVVPKETPKAVIDKLKEAGIKKVVKYDGSGESRKEAVLKFNNAVFEEKSEYGVKQEANGDISKGNLEKQIESLESQMDLISDDLKAMAENQLKKYKRLLAEMKAKKITKLSRSQVETLIKKAEIELPKLKSKYQKETEFLKKSANVNMNWRIAEERKKAQERVEKKNEQIEKIRKENKKREEKRKAEEAAKKEKAREEKAEREKLNKQKAFLAKVMKRVKYMRPEYQTKVRELLEAIQLTKPTAATIERLEKMKAFFEENEDAIIPDKVKKALERLNKTPFSELSEEDREAIVTAIQSYVALNDLKNELILNGRRRELKQIIANAVDNLKRRAKKSVFNEKNIDLTSSTEKEKSSTLKKIFTVDSYDGETLAQLLDNQVGNVLDKTNGIIHKIFFQGFNDGTAESLKYQYKAIDELVSTIKKLDTNIENWSEHFQKKKENVDILEVDLTKGRTIKLTKGQRINIFLNTFNKDNLDHMVNGGLSNRKDQDRIIKVTYEDVKKITDSLTDEEKRVAYKMKELLNREEKGDTREGLNRVFTLLNGYPIATVENYWPIKTNNYDTHKDPSKAFNDSIKETLEGMGSLKERKNAKNAVVIDDAFELFYESVKKSSAYIGMANPLRNAKTLLENKGFRTELTQRYGEEYYKTIKDMIQDVEANSIDTSNIEKLVLDTLHKVQGSILGLNFFTPLKQPVSYLNILPEMEIKYALKGLAGKVDFDKIAKLSPLLRFRLEGNVDREVGEIGSVGTLRKVYTGKESAASKMTFLIEAMDKLEIGRVWKAVEAEVKDKTNLEGDEYWNMVARRAEEVIFRHQPSTLPHHRSSIGRSSNAATRLLTTFSTQSNKVYNQIRREFLKYEVSDQGAADKATLLKNLGLSVFLAAILLQGVDDFRDWSLGRREKEFNEKLTNVFGYMIGNVYFVGPVFQSLTSDYSVQNPASGFLNDSVKTVKDIYAAIEDIASKEKYTSGENDGEEKWQTSVKKALEETLITVATFKGIPAKNIKNLANAANIGKRSENKVLDEAQSFKDEITKINKQIADKATPSARKAILQNRKKMLESKIRKVYNDNNVSVPKSYMTDAQKKALEAKK